ncbi:MAG: CIA30 family protein [Proteobacteria bacterium]|nr:CIA30 family protein [Pseudomonadota bacterium]
MNNEGIDIKMAAHINYRSAVLCTYALVVIILFTGDAGMSKEDAEKTIFSFSDPKAVEQWRPINDVVMGGVSQSTFKASGRGAALFTGIVSLENFGGFASASSRPADHDLSGCQGVAMRIKGDGKRYKCNIKTDTVFTGFSYQSPFNTGNGVWTVIKFPFNTFVPTFRGSAVSNAEPIDPKKVKSFGFLIADKQEGPFRLEIDWIKAFR